MRASTVETWAWVLIYGGLIAVVLGLVLRDPAAALGHALVAGGAVAAGGGVLLVWLRSRMRDDERR